MGYNITIGNAIPVFSKEDNILSAKWSVESKKLLTAPAYGEPTDYTNERWPSYTAWADSMEDLGLYDLFFNKYEGLMSERPGCSVLTQDHLDIIQKAVEKRLIKYPTIDNDGIDYVSARGEWLLFWVKWALENCETPAIENL